MGSLFSELKRRKVFRVAAAYLVGAWAILEFVSVVTPMLRLPEWAGPFVLMLLTIGFVAAIALSWTFEMTADGLKRTVLATGPADGTSQTTKFDWALMGALIIVIGVVAYDRIAPTTGLTTALNAPSAGGSISIAVLPFVNLSSDPEQEFFSDGMTEEITSALAKVHSLRVVGRTSAFEFKGQNKDLRAIGRALSASHLLEGSVRKAGSHVRITAQLIKADDGTHVWTENYDRELTNIFTTQDDIAKAIAGALKVPLGLQAGESLVASRTADTDSYQDYLRAKALVRARTPGTSLAEPIGLLEQVVARDPGYAPAWALLAMAHGLAPDYMAVRGRSADQLQPVARASHSEAETAGRRAIELDPRSADASVSLAAALMIRGRFMESEDQYLQALKLDPFNPDALHLYGALLAGVGRLKEAVAVRTQLSSLEPQVAVFNANTARILWANGQTEAALAISKTLPPQRALSEQVRIYASMDRYKEAADVIANAPPEIFPPDGAATAVRLLRMAPAPADPQDAPFLGGLSFVYLYTGLPDRALDDWKRGVEGGHQTPTGSFDLFHPRYAPARKTKLFKDLVRKSGHVEYWRARGWPDLCRPVDAEDFECD